MSRINHTIELDITGFSPLYTQMIALPVIATCIVGISAFSPNTLDEGNNYEAELVLNDDRNHIVVPIQTTGAASENFSGVEKCSVEIIPKFRTHGNTPQRFKNNLTPNFRNMSRRTGIRTNQQETADPENFPYEKGDQIKCTNAGAGEIVTGAFERLTRDGKKLLVIVPGKERFRWLKISEIKIERE